MGQHMHKHVKGIGYRKCQYLVKFRMFCHSPYSAIMSSECLGWWTHLAHNISHSCSMGVKSKRCYAAENHVKYVWLGVVVLDNTITGVYVCYVSHSLLAPLKSYDHMTRSQHATIHWPSSPSFSSGCELSGQRFCALLQLLLFDMAVVVRSRRFRSLIFTILSEGC